MGTNYYFITKSSKLAHEHFAKKYEWDTCYYDEEYELLDVPCFHYKIHLNKLSCGWRPLFQEHKAFNSFAKLEQFYDEHKDDLLIMDEYGDEYTWDEYKTEIIDHWSVTPEPMKFVIEDHGLFGGKYLTPTLCEEDEAEIYAPFDHVAYHKAERVAQARLNAWSAYTAWNNDYYNDPDYPIDWTKGEFC